MKDRKLIKAIFILGAVASAMLFPFANQAKSDDGIVMLVGDVLPLKNQVVWRNLVTLAKRREGENIIIAAAHKRAKLYGGFAVRSFEHYGTDAQLLPVAEGFQEFSTDFRQAAADDEIANAIRASSSVFFVGGPPQRLSNVLFTDKDERTKLADAIGDAHRSGSLIVGGLPGRYAVSTQVDAMEVLLDGRIEHEHVIPGLDLVDENWYVDQHFFGNGRFATTLVAMHQLRKPHGVGVGLDTVAVLHGDWIEVLGNRGVVVIDISSASFKKTRNGVEMLGIRLNYMENGDRFNTETGEMFPYEKKLQAFELVPQGNASDQVDTFVSSQDLFQPREFQRLMYEAIESKTGQSQGYALHHGSRAGFRFRFYTDDRSRGWLTTSDGPDEFSLYNIILDIIPLEDK